MPVAAQSLFNHRGRTMKKLVSLIAIGVVALTTSGCVLLAGAGAGYVAHDEATEGDGNFDPLEDVRDDEDGKN